MSISQNTSSNPTEWWAKLGLQPIGYDTSSPAHQVLAKHPPVTFASGSDQHALTLEQVAELMTQATERITRLANYALLATAEERQRFGWERLQEAFNMPDAQVQISESRWAGFTKGEATAWCWNLMQYEPKGFIAPGMYTRRGAARELANGGLPEVFGYPERARELADEGLDPREYRRRREAANAPTFCEADVTIQGYPPTA